MKLNDQIEDCVGVGPKAAEKLKRLGIETVRDLIFYYPRRYDDFTNPKKISDLKVGDNAILKAKIFSIHQNRTRRRWMSIVEARVVDDFGGEIKAVWFNQPFLVNVLKPGTEWLFLANVKYDFQSKEKILYPSQYESADSPSKIYAVYPETKGLTSKFLRKIIAEVISEKIFPDEFLPKKIIMVENLIDLESAVKKIHLPKNNIEIDQAKKRFAFDELFLIALKLLIARKELNQTKAVSLPAKPEMLKSFVKSLPYKLTDSQRKAAWEIIQDLKNTRPMNRLLEGDVGSGKTIVAAFAAYVTAQNQMQSAWLAPTEILANQHHKNVTEVLKPFKIKVGLLTGAFKKADLKKDDLIIGTHALLEKNIEIPKLALTIIDEQHRFGVAQRGTLQSKKIKNRPHFLSMTATPIPRTLALSLYGDLDLSIIDEMPEGRKKIFTKFVPPQNRQKAYDFIKKEVEFGRQVFVICPLIEAKDDLKINLFETDRKSAIAEYKKLSEKIFPDLKIGLLHGRLKSIEKNDVMKKFADGKIDILVSTAVVEVGVDVPNATIMMVESAEKFGLAQLHQFRGRVGRGSHQSYCMLFSDSRDENAQKRLKAMEKISNGFELAEMDLKMRGPGEFVGTKQSGLPDLKMASLSDIIMVKKARLAAEKIMAENLENFPKLKEKLKELETQQHLE